MEGVQVARARINRPHSRRTLGLLRWITAVCSPAQFWASLSSPTSSTTTFRVSRSTIAIRLSSRQWQVFPKTPFSNTPTTTWLATCLLRIRYRWIHPPELLKTVSPQPWTLTDAANRKVRIFTITKRNLDVKRERGEVNGSSLAKRATANNGSR